MVATEQQIDEHRSEIIDYWQQTLNFRRYVALIIAGVFFGAGLITVLLLQFSLHTLLGEMFVGAGLLVGAVMWLLVRNEERTFQKWIDNPHIPNPRARVVATQLLDAL